MASAPSNDLWIAALTLSIVFLTILWYKLNKEESRLPPGPRGLPIVGFLPFLRANLHHQLTELSQQYGPIYKFWLGGKLCVVLNSPSLAKEVVRDQDSVFANRDPPIAGLVATYGGLDIGFSPYGPIGVICANCLELVIKYLQILGKPNISDFFPMLARFDLQGIQKDAEALLKSVESILDPAINEHLKMLSDRREGEIPGNEKKDFIQILLELMEQKDIGISLDLVKIKAILVDIVIGGTDSTITTVEWVMTELLNNPETMSKVQQELKHVVGMNNIVEESHLPELHYLDAVLKETLRLHPALPLLLPKRPSQCAIVGGYTIPEGTKGMMNIGNPESRGIYK
ncbi:hypothetical protein H5410_043520 [Solanum commersonii]|uniref:Cytochrome P450 n=1 Tax=Solanum commersonii TaxID=4109 RepID=A0A9J5Y1M6_SOLCO|nr:hypothetical protein H5410_043520 [Solanum commersonii]